MASYTIFKFKGLTPLHLGNGRESYDFSSSELQSDTLVSALAAIYVLKHGDKGLTGFLNSFVLSSAFPYSGKRNFLPKPSGFLNVSVKGKDDTEYRKQLKRIRYIELPLWSELTKGNRLEVNPQQVAGSFLVEDGTDFGQPFVTQVNQRVSVPRGGKEKTDPFFFEWKFFNEDSGLYCIVKTTDGQSADKLFELFRTLGENGIGTDRSVGGGRFEIEKSAITLPDVGQSDATMLLSLYIPAESEIESLNLTKSNYGLLLRGGYMSGSQYEEFRHLHKKSIYMFDVGSWFMTTTPLEGRIVDLRPDWNDERMHPVYRNGRPFTLPIKTSTYGKDKH